MSTEILGRDLRLESGLFGFGLALDLGDLDTVTGVDNLVQALLIRFNTPLGDLAALGHPDFGSRLHDLIGSGNTETTRNLVRLFTLETLRQEPRVREVRSLVVQTIDGQPDRVLVSVDVVPIDSPTPVNLVFSVGLEGTP
jgi:phage baseplate assembly protein W